MKTLFISLAILVSNVGFGAVIMNGNPVHACTYGELSDCFFSTTSLPTVVALEVNHLNSDDAMVQLADEVTGEVDSTEMIDKMAAHFETSAYLVVSAVSDLLDTEEGLSFEGLKQELQ